MKHFSKNI